MKTISCYLPDSLESALQQRMDADKESRDHIVARALSQYLATPLHTLFQVSTSAALVEGIYQGAVRVSRLYYSTGISGWGRSLTSTGRW
jgi:acetolactate decarboxylase